MIPDGQDGPRRGRRTVLYCRSGGGLPGLQAHAGMWAALASHGYFSTHNAGTSAGAIAAAFDSAGRSPGYFFSVMDQLRTADVRRDRFAWKLRLPWISSILDNAPIRALLNQHLPSCFADLDKPLTTFMTSLRYGWGDWCDGEPDDSFDSLRAAVLASMSIAGVFEPVVGRDGVPYSDGGTFNNPALPRNWRDFDEVWLLIASGRTDAKAGEGSVLSRLMGNIGYFGRGQISDALLETGALGPMADTNDAMRDAALDELMTKGWLAHDRVSPFTGRVQKIRVLWPAFEDDGALRFVHKLHYTVMDAANTMLHAMTAALLRKAETQRIQI